MKLLRVTDAIKLNGLIDDEWLTELGCKLGSALHAARHLDDRSPTGLDPSSVDPRISGSLQSYRLWREKVRPDIVDSEAEWKSEALGLVGHPDFTCFIDGAFWIVDLKRGAKCRWHKYQLALYALLWCALNPGKPTPRRANLYLDKEGGLPVFDEHRDRRDFERAKALITVANIHLENGKEAA